MNVAPTAFTCTLSSARMFRCFSNIEISFVDQQRRLQGMAGSFVREGTFGDPTQISDDGLFPRPKFWWHFCHRKPGSRQAMKKLLHKVRMVCAKTNKASCRASITCPMTNRITIEGSLSSAHIVVLLTALRARRLVNR